MEGPMDTDLLVYIRDLVERNPGQMTFDEYGEIADAIIRQAPCRVLVFGCGRDTPLWLKANRDGETVFVEHSAKWAAAARALCAAEISAEPEIRTVTYRTLLENWQRDIQTPAALAVEKLEPLGDGWDVVIVDAPPGGGRKAQGRLQSIYEAGRRCKPGGLVFVHDTKRECERAAADALLVAAHGYKARKLTRNLSAFRRPTCTTA